MEGTKKVEVPEFLYDLLEDSAKRHGTDVKTVVRRMFVKCYGSKKVFDAVYGVKED